MKKRLAMLALWSLLVTFAHAKEGFTKQELIDLGEAYAEAINSNSLERFNAITDEATLANRIADLIGDSEREKSVLVKEFLPAIPVINRQLLGQLAQQQARATVLAVREVNGIYGPLLRLEIGDGFNYAVLLPVRDQQDESKVLVGDSFFSTTGELQSESVGIAGKLMSKPSPEFLNRIFGQRDIDIDLVEKFQRFGQLRQQGRLQEAYDLIDNFPSTVRNHRLVIVNAIQVASRLDDELYLKELSRLAQHHGENPKVTFALLDHYFFKGDYEAASKALDLMAKTYGDDGLVNVFRANIAFEQSDMEEALKHTRTAIRIEPDFELARWTLLTILIETKRYDECVAVLDVLNDRFGYALSRADFTADPFYDGFLNSQAFDQWEAR
ncbi:MAG: hypothetical protein AAAFM81_09205 [Pseudomonadota bacterium]